MMEYDQLLSELKKSKMNFSIIEEQKDQEIIMLKTEIK